MKPAKKNPTLAERVIALVEAARRKVAAVADVTLVYTYYEIGKMVVEEEQGGKNSAIFLGRQQDLKSLKPPSSLMLASVRRRYLPLSVYPVPGRNAPRDTRKSSPSLYFVKFMRASNES